VLIIAGVLAVISVPLAVLVFLGAVEWAKLSADASNKSRDRGA
jgi:hypothetical protein